MKSKEAEEYLYEIIGALGALYRAEAKGVGMPSSRLPRVIRALEEERRLAKRVLAALREEEKSPTDKMRFFFLSDK